MSYLAWIDFDPDERRRAQTLIDLFKQPEARDELGLGTVRDGLSDILFPGTSTIQTRLRYLLFIPWIYQAAQEQKGTQSARSAFAREHEFLLSEALLHSGETNGVIGSEAGRDLKRLASSVYWAGLHILGIRAMSGTQATFLSYGPESMKDYDFKLWASSLPDRPKDLFETASFRISEKEGAFLRDRITAKAGKSLFAELMHTGRSFDEDWPWEINDPAVSAANGTILKHAERFSGVMYGASILYNLLLALRAAQRPNAKTHVDAPELIDKYRSRLSDWKREMNMLSLNDWELDDLFGLISTTSHSITRPSRDFIRHWTMLALEGVTSLETDQRAIDLLTQREHGLKRRKARLLYDAPLERWSGASGDARIDFRWAIANNYINELANAG